MTTAAARCSVTTDDSEPPASGIHVPTAPFFSPPYEPPIQLGSGGFRVAGIVYVALEGFVDKRVKGGLEHVRSILPPSVRQFMEQKFRRSSWYDAVPLPYLSRSIAAARGMSVEEHLRDVNRFHANSGVVDLYGALLRIITPEGVALALPRAQAVVQQFGGVSTKVVGPRHVSGERTGVPEVLVRWFALSNGPFLEGVLERGGALRARVDFRAAQPRDVRDGQRLYDLPFDVTWDEPV